MAATSKQTMQYAFGPYFSIVLQFRAFYDRCRKRGAVPVAREQRKLAAILAAEVVDVGPTRGRIRVRSGERTFGRPARMFEQRRLAAIVSADVAGYSRLMGRG
jgi:hypothetical protein